MTLNKKYFEETVKPLNPNMSLKFDSSNPNRFWVQLKQKDAKGKLVVMGQVLVQVDVLLKDQAKTNPVGKARDQPNHSPQLPQPEGRMELTMNPMKMFNQLVGPEVRRKIQMALCMAVCILLTLAILPNLIAGLITSAIVG
mmetsp:Transcript_12511/g.21058  ORF Transcript_12511/g.21058 Transcript_12511/m.21058 type:complete len:141 (+) Transcript_12511:1163-1585(+)